jgi:acyl dehydratase
MLGQVHGPFETALDPERIERFATATRGPVAGGSVPAAFLAMLAFELQGPAFGDIPPAVKAAAGAMVHGSHDVRLDRALVPGEVLSTTTRLTGVRPNRAGTVVVQSIEHRDAAGAVAARQWWSFFLGGVQLPEDGEAPPDHAWPDDVRARPLGQVTVPVDDALARAYAEVSGDWSEHHFDATAAARAGAAGPFLHGLCTLSICGHAVGDPGRVRRLAGRFAAPTLLGHDLVIDRFAADAGRVAFEATCAGVVVVRNGLAELV